MLFLIFAYVGLIYYIARCFLQFVELRTEAKVSDAAESYQALLVEKEKTSQEKAALEKKAAEIFTLYDMTKEITKKFNEEAAFEVFKTKLHETVKTEDCRFVSVDSGDLEKAQSAQENFVFTLKSKREKLGYLIFRGLQEEDKDKIMILGHQFALALRRVKLYEAIEELAITDSLTGVHTRRHFIERFEEELKRSMTRKIDLSLLMIDVDYFKNFNDKYGHLAGDQILQGIGKIIKEHIREIDIVGRFGGEEFCVVLPVTDRYGANFAAERIRTAVEATSIKAYDTTVKVTVSIGIATFPLDGKTSAELVDKSDWALYRAKKKGRNCICAFGVYE